MSTRMPGRSVSGVGEHPVRARDSHGLAKQIVLSATMALHISLFDEDWHSGSEVANSSLPLSVAPLEEKCLSQVPRDVRPLDDERI